MHPTDLVPDEPSPQRLWLVPGGLSLATVALTALMIWRLSAAAGQQGQAADWTDIYLLGGLIVLTATASAVTMFAQLRTQSADAAAAELLDSEETFTRASTPLPQSLKAIRRDLKGAITTLATERDRFQAVLAGMAEAVIALDADGMLTLINPAATRLVGIGQGRYGHTLLESIRVPELADVAESALRGESCSAEFELRRRTPEPSPPRRLIANATPQESGGCVITLLDVTEVRRLETIRRDFVANVSHELRTPVSIISASTEALLDGALEDPDYCSHFLSAIERNAARLGALIEDLLRIARMEEGRMNLQLAEVDLERLVTSTVEVLGPQINDRRHRMVIDVPSDTFVLADSGALEQVLVNLLENASKYTPDKGTILIRTTTDTKASNIRLEIADDGPGIAEHHRPRLFERFYRVDSGRAREVGGTGLGLAIVKHLAEAMNGTVGMMPNEPRGSVFWLSLPKPASAAHTDAPAETGEG